MIDDLAVIKSANFFSIKKRFSNIAIERLFVSLRANYNVSTNNEFKYTRELIGNARYSAICFKYESAPSFLKKTTELSETLCGYLLLIEYQTHNLNTKDIFSQHESNENQL